MTFETTIGQTFPELSAKIQPAYRNVSVRQLLAHAGGIPPYRTRESLQWLLTLKGTPTEQRYAFVERVLTEPPRFEPGTRREYSNAGAAIAGAMAERIGGSPYPQLVQQLVFARLGGHAAFGNPGLSAEPQPWGHMRTILARSRRSHRRTRFIRPLSRSNRPATHRHRCRTTGAFCSCTCVV